MARNKLMDLNNHLFEQLERLNDVSLSDVELDREIKRGKAMTDVAGKIIDNANIVLSAEKTRLEYGSSNTNNIFKLEDKQ